MPRLMAFSPLVLGVCLAAAGPASAQPDSHTVNDERMTRGLLSQARLAARGGAGSEDCVLHPFSLPLQESRDLLEMSAAGLVVYHSRLAFTDGALHSIVVDVGEHDLLAVSVTERAGRCIKYRVTTMARE